MGFRHKKHSPNAVLQWLHDCVQIYDTDPLCVVDDVFPWSYHHCYEKKRKLVHGYSPSWGQLFICRRLAKTRTLITMPSRSARIRGRIRAKSGKERACQSTTSPSREENSYNGLK